MLWIWTFMLLLAVVQVPVMIRKRELRELAVYGGMWLWAGIYASLVFGRFAGDIVLLNHTDAVLRVMEALYHWLGINV